MTSVTTSIAASGARCVVALVYWLSRQKLSYIKSLAELELQLSVALLYTITRPIATEVVTPILRYSQWLS